MSIAAGQAKVFEVRIEGKGGIAVTESELIEAEQYARRFGSANCWTGTSGTLSGYVIQLIREVRMLREMIESSNGGLKDELSGVYSKEAQADS